MSDGVKYKLRSKNGYAWSFIGTNGIQSHPPTYTLIADRLLMRFHWRIQGYFVEFGRTTQNYTHKIS